MKPELVADEVERALKGGWDDADARDAGRYLAPMIMAWLADAWNRGALSAVEPHNAGTHMTLRAVLPFPENPYRVELHGETT